MLLWTLLLSSVKKKKKKEFFGRQVAKQTSMLLWKDSGNIYLVSFVTYWSWFYHLLSCLAQWLPLFLGGILSIVFSTFQNVIPSWQNYLTQKLQCNLERSISNYFNLPISGPNSLWLWVVPALVENHQLLICKWSDYLTV